MDILEFATKYWLQLVVTSGTAIVIYIIKSSIKMVVEQMMEEIDEHFKEDIAEQEVIKYGVLSLSHYILYKQCQFLIDRGYVTVSELDDLEHLYSGYSALGGNGTGTKLYEDCKNLPIKSEFELNEVKRGAGIN